MAGLGPYVTLDYHTAGEPLRIVTAGLPVIPGETMLEKRRFMAEQLDDVRTHLMWEPRGHADMYGAVITGPVNPGSDCGVLFMHNEGYSTMCGHGIIALATAAAEQGVFTARDLGNITIDTPAGVITARYQADDEAGSKVTFTNVPAFVLHPAVTFECSAGRGEATIAFGGAYYAYVDAAEWGIRTEPEHSAELIALGIEIKKILADSIAITHPVDDPGLGFLYGVIFTEFNQPNGPAKNVCVFAQGELDRSPTGTGVSGLAAILHARGDLQLGEQLTIESILGTRFTVRCSEETRVGNLASVLTEVTGSAYLTGEHRFSATEKDPLLTGFLLR